MTNENYYDNKFNEIPKDLLMYCASLIKKEIPLNIKNDIKQTIEQDGLNNWIVPYHSQFGREIRNLFRENGFTDDMLPDKNWDDYYAQVIEYAFGYR